MARYEPRIDDHPERARAAECQIIEIYFDLISF